MNPYQGLKEIQGLKSLTIQAAFSTTKPCVSKTEQRPSPQKGLGFLLQTRERFSACWLILFDPAVVSNILWCKGFPV